MSLPERLQQILKYTQLSVRGLAIKCGLKQQTLDKHIKGISEPSAITLINIAIAYPEISGDWLLTGDGEMIKTATITDIDRIASLVDTIATLQKALADKDKTIALLTSQIDQLKNRIN